MCLSFFTNNRQPLAIFFPLCYTLPSLQRAFDFVFWHFTHSVTVENNKWQTFSLYKALISFPLRMRVCSFRLCWSGSCREEMEVSLAAYLTGLKMCSWVWGSAHAKMLLTMRSAPQSFSITHSWCASVWYFTLFVGFFCMVSSASLSGCRMGLVWNTPAGFRKNRVMEWSFGSRQITPAPLPERC